jgi:predicted nucleic acid-binding protein
LTRRAVVADASPLIALALIDHLTLLDDLFDEVLVPEAVAAECTAELSRPGARAIHDAIEGRRLRITGIPTSALHSDLAAILDPGEAAAIVLAQEKSLPVLMDERRGRTVATRMGLRVVGTAGLLVTAKDRGLIRAVAPLLDDMREQGYRLSDALVAGVLQRCGE